MTKRNTRRGCTQENQNRWVGQILPANALASIGQVKPDVSRKQFGELSGSRLTYKGYFGFTLIELLVVVLIIGILAAVALPQYNKAVKKAQGREALVAINALDKGLNSYYLEHGTYEGASATTLNLDVPALQHFKYKNFRNVTSSTFIPALLQVGSAIVTMENANGIRLSANWYTDGSLIVKCSVEGMSTASCSDYFNCQGTPRTYYAVGDLVGTSQATYAFYGGGDCILN